MGNCLGTFETLLGHVWNSLGIFLGHFWDMFGTVLGNFWDTFGTCFWPRYNNYAVPNITFKHTKGSGKGNNRIKIRYYLSVQTSVIFVIFID